MQSIQEDFTCIAIDMGAGSIRVMLGEIRDELISFREVHRISNEIVVKNGHERWDMEHIVKEIKKGISNAIEVSERTPQSIGADAWGVDYVLLDEDGKLADIPVAYRDKRTEGMEDEWKTLMTENETFRRTGINFYIFNTLFQLLSSRNTEPMIKSKHLLFIPGYLNYLLSGSIYNELTISSTSQLLRVDSESWDHLILEKLNLDADMLGRIIAPGTLLGPVKIPEVRGLQMENVAVCGHDTACVVAAIPVENPDYAYISAGTWCMVGIESKVPLISDDALNLGLTNERGYNHTYRTLKNIVGLWLIQGLKKNLPGGTSFAEMEAMTREGDSNVPVIDPDDPVFYNPEDMKEAFDAYFIKTGQPIPESFGTYICCAYDSLCFSFRYHIDKMEKISGKSIGVLHILGGGSQSDYLNQRIASICERKVVSGPVEGAILGNILIQAIAMGKIAGLEEGRALVKKSSRLKSYDPEKEPAVERYHRFIQLKEN
ncbi:MAG: rhamnulokinase family protein [Bacteroidota bacterium]